MLKIAALAAIQRQFMLACGQDAPDSPEFNEEGAVLWLSLMDEEMNELTEALANYKRNPYDITAMAELTAEAVDFVYVLLGFMNSQGLPFDAMFAQIHGANMRKVGPDGKVIRRDDGKILKPDGWEPANKVQVIIDALENPNLEDDLHAS